MAQNKMTNGEMPHSVTVDHLFQYPLLSQSFDFYQKQPLGAKSLTIVNNLYARTSPYFATPASYVAPYASKIDEIGDHSLSTVDNYIPAFKNTGFDTLHNYATFPFRYARNTYVDEYKKTTRRDGEGLISFGKAVISTELRIASDSFQYVADFLGPRKDEAADKFSQFKDSAQQKASDLLQASQGKLNEARDTDFSKKADEYAKTAQNKTNELAGTAQAKKDEYQKDGEKQANHYSSKAQQKKDDYASSANQKKEQLVNGN